MPNSVAIRCSFWSSKRAWTICSSRCDNFSAEASVRQVFTENSALPPPFLTLSVGEDMFASDLMTTTCPEAYGGHLNAQQAFRGGLTNRPPTSQGTIASNTLVFALQV